MTKVIYKDIEDIAKYKISVTWARIRVHKAQGKMYDSVTLWSINFNAQLRCI